MRSNPFEGQLERLARTLTEQFGVEVVCQGDNAWTDGRQTLDAPGGRCPRAGKPRLTSGPARQGQIVLPSVPEPLDEALERCLIGYLDHELGHVAFSDFQVAEECTGRHPGFAGLLNVVEDPQRQRLAHRK